MSETEERRQEAPEHPIVTEAPMRLCPAGAVYMTKGIASGESDEYELDVALVFGSGSILVGVRVKGIEDGRLGHRYYRVNARELMRAAVDHYEAEGWPEPEELDHG